MTIVSDHRMKALAINTVQEARRMQGHGAEAWTEADAHKIELVFKVLSAAVSPLGPKFSMDRLLEDISRTDMANVVGDGHGALE